MAQLNQGIVMRFLPSNAIFIVSGFLMLGGCATTINENPSSVELEPMEKPSIVAGSRIIQLDKKTGDERYYQIDKINEDGTHSGSNQDNCQWQVSGDQVSPATSWAECGGSGAWSSGEHRNMKISGDIWPLSVGNKASYTYNQVNANGEVKDVTSRRCKVRSQVNIETVLGSLDTYKVTCVRHKGNWSKTRTYYFNPEYDQAVKYIESSSSNGVEKHYELVRVEDI